MSLKCFMLFALIFRLARSTVADSARVVEVPHELQNWTFTEIESDRESVQSVENSSAEEHQTRSDSRGGEKHPCNRKCVENSEPATCRYNFRVEYYQTMSKSCRDCTSNVTHCTLRDCIPADGVKRAITVVNRQMPGPAIEVCINDTVEVTLENWLFEETTSIHWHGQHQRGSQFMDGVPYVTQCPISPKTTFVYRFNASTPGTHFWHSHSGFQRGDGVYGALIVRLPPSEDQYSDLYDYDLSEHVMSIMDWIHTLSLWKYVAHHHSDGDNKPVNILVNGRGRYRGYESGKMEIFRAPLEKFTVKQGYRYRFRVINSGSLNCPIEISADNHTLVVINSDGSDLDPVEARSLISYAGERFDFIIDMNQDVDNYWFRFRGLMDCDERFNSVFQTAVLHYEGAGDDEPTAELAYDIAPKGLQINAMNTGKNTSDSLIMSELRSSLASSKDPRLKPKADFKFFISYDFYPKDNIHYHMPLYYGFNDSRQNVRVYTPQLNHISMKFPSFPLMANLEDSNKLEFCNSSSIPEECETKYCECTHLLKVPKGAVVELILIDKGFIYNANHPFHLHGYNFRVIGMDRLGNNVTEKQIRDLDEKGLLMRNLKEAPVKDTVTVPDGGYTILRWHATNPGFWLFHCHIEFHMEIGMALIFKVGDDIDCPSVPKNFPQCKHYYPAGKPGTEEIINYKIDNKDESNEIIFKQIDNNYLKISSRTTSISNLSHSDLIKITDLLILLVFIIFY